jgi:hypothetical protein
VKVRILPSAQDDLSDGFVFYEKQQRDLGAYFLDSLTLYAGIHRQFHGRYRLLGRTFPFAVYYEINGDTADIKAVLDCRRDPTWIKRQLARP